MNLILMLFFSLLHNAQSQRAKSYLNQFAETPLRDYWMAITLLAQGTKYAARKACQLLILRVLAGDYTKDSQPNRIEVLTVLRDAAHVADKELEQLLTCELDELGSVLLQHLSSATVGILKAFYLGDSLSGSSLAEKVKKEQKSLQNSIRLERAIDPEDYYFQVLKDYSSYTPLLTSPQTGHLGGGYFLAIGGYGCVIDPGHHFIDNFSMAQHSISDINCIIVTHFHDDHYADLPALLSLLFQRSRHDIATKSRSSLRSCHIQMLNNT